MAKRKRKYTIGGPVKTRPLPFINVNAPLPVQAIDPSPMNQLSPTSEYYPKATVNGVTRDVVKDGEGYVPRGRRKRATKSNKATGVGRAKFGTGGDLQMLGGVASLIPGYGTAIGAGLNVVGGMMEQNEAKKAMAGQQAAQRQASMPVQNDLYKPLNYETGGSTDQSIIDIQKGELGIKGYQIVKRFTGDLFSPHNKSGKDPENNYIDAEKNDIDFVIPKHLATQFEQSDKLGKDSIKRQVQKDFDNRNGSNFRTGGPVMKYVTGGPYQPGTEGASNPFGLYDLKSGPSQSPSFMSYPQLGQMPAVDETTMGSGLYLQDEVDPGFNVPSSGAPSEWPSMQAPRSGFLGVEPEVDPGGKPEGVIPQPKGARSSNTDLLGLAPIGLNALLAGQKPQTFDPIQNPYEGEIDELTSLDENLVDRGQIKRDITASGNRAMRDVQNVSQSVGSYMSRARGIRAQEQRSLSRANIDADTMDAQTRFNRAGTLGALGAQNVQGQNTARNINLAIQGNQAQFLSAAATGVGQYSSSNKKNNILDDALRASNPELYGLLMEQYGKGQGTYR